MSARHHERVGLNHWRLPDDPQDINPEILQARAEGRQYGDLGDLRPPDQWPQCRQCWGDRYVWYGNAWGVKHVEHRPDDWPAGGFRDALDCPHHCHQSDPPTSG